MAEEATADIVLAECNGTAWLVRGEQHIDDLLGNTLSRHVSIEIIACESKSAVDSLWHGFGGGLDEDGDEQMWLIHPAIVNRARRGVAAGRGEATVVFAAWSAALDDAAQSALTIAVDAAAARPDAVLAVIRHVPDAAPPMAGEMANLRAGLLEAQLAALGVAPSRMLRETVAGTPETADHIILMVREA